MAGALTKAGRYQIVSELGRGSMGVVYQAFDPVIGRTVAIKTMLTEGLGPAEFEEFKARFQREAQAAGILTHPNIVTVYDFGEDSGILFLAMEFLEGKSLQALVEEQGILPVETIIPMYEQVCSALDHAHIHKIVHRDIKPANIMILESGLVKLTDFGIAKMMTVGMTQAGQILGTPNYMSPEQVKGRQVDGRSDIFSLGVILYELVTGEKPFGGQNITTVIYKIINENPISPRELDATIPLGLSYSIQKALAKSPDERYQTCRELAEDLRNYKNLGGAAAPSATVVFRRPPIQTMGAEPAPPPAVQPARVQPTKAQAPAQAQAPAEPQPVRPLSVQVIHPPKPQAHGTSPVVWVLLALLLLGGGGSGYYFFVHKPQTQQGTQSPPASEAPAPQQDTSTPPDLQVATTGQGETGATTTAGPGPTEQAAGQSTTTVAEPAPKPLAETGTGGPPMPAQGTGRTSAVPKSGQLVVSSNPPGARITIDGRSNPQWVTPYTIPDLPAGYHTVVVSKEGHGDAERNVSIEGGRASTIDAVLTMPGGEISIETKPPGVEVLIDGQPVGLSPVRRTVSLGQHTYTLSQAGRDPYTSPFEIKYDGHMLTKKVDLGGGPVVPTGIIEVRTIPYGATVYADGKPVQGTTPTNFRLPAGRHTLTISLSGYPPLQKEVDVPPDGSVTVNEKLARQ
jgi:serine/threonine-protein kinase